jgi:hypothetical protein
MLYRGNVTYYEEIKAISDLEKKHTKEFAEWSKTRYKIGISKQHLIMVTEGDLGQVPVALCRLACTSAITQAWGRLKCEFVRTVDMHHIVHEYATHGVEWCLIEGARHALDKLQQDYIEYAMHSSEGE